MRAGNKKRAAALRPAGAVDKQISRVRGTVDGKTVDSKKWMGDKVHPGMVAILATADRGTAVEMDVQDASGGATTTMALSPADLNWYRRTFVQAVGWLPDDPTQSLIWIVVFFIGLCIIGSIFRYWQQFLGMTIANRVVMDIRRRMYDRGGAVAGRDISRRAGTSDVMSRLTQDTNTLTEGVSMALGKAVPGADEGGVCVCAGDVDRLAAVPRRGGGDSDSRGDHPEVFQADAARQPGGAGELVEHAGDHQRDADRDAW